MKRVVVLLMVIVSAGVLHSQVYMYGTTSGGGANGRGTIFRTDANGQNFEKVYDFTVATGGNPYAGLTLANDGLLYGFTQTGGQIVNPGAVVALGTFYKFDPTNNMLTVIEYIDDQSPFGVAFADAPILGSDGLLYALSPYNTLVNPTDGKMWSYDVTTGTISILGSIDYVTIGVCDSQLMQASDGKIYFTTRHEAGTPGEFGKIMQFDPQSATFTVLHSSLGATGNPPGTISDYEDAINNPLFEASNGVLYGCSERGGNFQVGNMFKINKDGSGYEVIDFCFSDIEDEGYFPVGGFVERNGLLYSATQQENTLGAYNGTFFTIDLTNDDVNYVHILENEGRRPRGTFVEAANGKFYIQCDGGASSAGSIVEYNPANGLSVATHYFNGTADGADPQRNALCIVDLTDTTPPIALCQNITVSLDQNGAVTITAAQVDNGSNDNQGSVSLSVSPDSFDCSNIGPNTVTLTVTDTSGNTATCTAVVTVEDNTAPVAVCQNITVQLDVNGNVTITPAQVDDGSTDACGIASFSVDNDTFDCSNVGSNTVVLTVTDASGNSNSCNATVTVEDNIAPTMACQDITIQLDANGIATITPADIDNGSTDACGIGIRFLDTTFFDCSNIGTNTVILGIIDVNGNVATCSAVVTVEDTLAPVLECPEDDVVYVEAGTTYSIPDYAAFGDVTATDNCTDPLVISQDPAPGTELSVGTYTVSFETTDDEGNTNSCSFLLTVDELLGNSDSEFDKDLVIFPNPMKNSLTIENSSNLSISEIRLFDTMGRMVMKTNAASNSLDVSGLNSGLYFINIQTDHGLITRKIIKE